jgi:hypothetical protein
MYPIALAIRVLFLFLRGNPAILILAKSAVDADPGCHWEERSDAAIPWKRRTLAGLPRR